MKTIKYKETEVYRTVCGKFGENPELSCNRVGELVHCKPFSEEWRSEELSRGAACFLKESLPASQR